MSQRLALAAARASSPSMYACGHRLVRVAGEEQRDVDVDALGDERPDGGDARWRRRHLDHHVGPRHGLPEPPRLGERARGVVGEVGRDLQAHVAVVRRGPVVDAAAGRRRRPGCP